MTHDFLFSHIDLKVYITLLVVSLILKELKTLFRNSHFYTFFMLFHGLLITCVNLVLIPLVIEDEVILSRLC